MRNELGQGSRRTFLKAAALLLAGPLPKGHAVGGDTAVDSAEPIGTWGSENDLPVFEYTGKVPFPSQPGVPAEYLPNDPYFLLGNYRLTLFVHVSGRYQLLTGERAWGRMNQGDEPWSGQNSASVEVDGGDRTELVGLEAPPGCAAMKRFGVGFAEYTYAPHPDLRVTRTLSVAPSEHIHEGISAFVLSVSLKNTGKRTLRAVYKEGVRARYAPILASFDPNLAVVQYHPLLQPSRSPHSAACAFKPKSSRPLAFPPGSGSTPLEAKTPTLFLQLLSARKGASVSVAGEENGRDTQLGATATCTIEAGQEVLLQFAVGYSRGGPAEMTSFAASLQTRLSAAGAPHFREQWHRVLPQLAGEHDPDLRREMRWNAAALEQMATWKQYYNETLIPQGMTYDYVWGRMLSSRDWAQHALPLCHTNPALAKSVLRLIMKRMRPDGEIELNDQGFGWSESGSMRTSDQQLWFFLLLNEYLRVTRDTAVLTETLSYHPAEGAASASGFEHVQSAFLFLRDRIGTGPHGLVRLWNSDWNDLFYSWPTEMPYNEMFNLAESHMNTAMTIVILGDLAGTLVAAGTILPPAELKPLLQAIAAHRAALLQAFLADWGTRPFPRRAYLGHGQAAGENEMWLEPQPYALLIPELPEARKRALWREIDRRLLQGEAMGARQIESPTARGGTKPGTRENGGFWFALHGPLVLGAATFDPALANRIFERFTLAHYRRMFPNYWVGQWTASDEWDAASTPTQGLSSFMPYCAHAHAWPLYCYLRLQELRPRLAHHAIGDRSRQADADAVDAAVGAGQHFKP